MYIITLLLHDGINIYCGKVKFYGHIFDEWDTDFYYGKIYRSKQEAKKVRSRLITALGQEYARVHHINKYRKKFSLKKIHEEKLVFTD